MSTKISLDKCVHVSEYLIWPLRAWNIFFIPFYVTVINNRASRQVAPTFFNDAAYHNDVVSHLVAFRDHFRSPIHVYARTAKRWKHILDRIVRKQDGCNSRLLPSIFNNFCFFPLLYRTAKFLSLSLSLSLDVVLKHYRNGARVSLSYLLCRESRQSISMGFPSSFFF